MLGVIGDVVQDVVVWLLEDVRPATDTKSEITMTRGGSAANVAAFAGPRCPTRFIGCVGDDLGGLAVTRELESHGVDVRMQVAGSTGMIVVLIDSAGERTMFPSRGASSMIHDVPCDWLDDIDLLHLTGYSLQDEPAATAVLDAAQAVKARGGRVSFDVSSTGMIDLYGLQRFQDLVVDLAPDYISANEDETTYLQLADGDTPGPLLDRLPATTLLARAGKRATRIFQGARLVDSVDVEPAEHVRDMTGAGDAFNAGFLAATTYGKDVREAVVAAHSLARLVLAHPGASDGSTPDVAPLTDVALSTTALPDGPAASRPVLQPTASEHSTDTRSAGAPTTGQTTVRQNV